MKKEVIVKKQEHEKFQHFMDSLSPSNKDYTYFVN